MSIRKGKNNSIEPLETQDLSAERSDAEEEYSANRKTRRRKTAWVFIVFVLIQSILLSYCSNAIKDADLERRVHRELAMKLSGKIALKTGEYTGETDFGYFDGEGRFAFDSGTTYQGEWNDNEIEGVGILKVPSDGKYEGEFKDSQKQGEGTYTWSDGTVYSGRWDHDQMDGKGKYTEKNGLVCEGTFKDNHFDTGTCSFKNKTGKYFLSYRKGNISEAKISFSDGTTYSGTLNSSSEKGSGVVQYKDGDKYQGEVASGKRDGEGVYTWSSGESYDGQWVKDSMSGEGIYKFSNGNTLEGTFSSNDFIDGKYSATNDFGKYVFTIEDGKATKVVIALNDGTTFEGDMKDNKLTGSAQIRYSNGDSYSGSVVEGKKSGSGVYSWSNGAKYDGAWSDDTMNGKGTYTYPTNQTGLKLEGSFVSGSPNGTCEYYVSNAEHYETNWQNGRCIKVIE